MRLVIPSLIVMLVSLSGSKLAADITWIVTYNDVVNNTNVGFDDPGLGVTRRNTLQSVLNYIDTVVDENGSAELRVNNSQTDGTGALASAGPFFFTGPPGFYNGFLFDHATTGVDPSASNPDATMTVDFGRNWNSDLGNPAGNEFDLFTVLLHEVTHAMGFLSLMNANGSSGINNGVYSVYDSHLERADGTLLFPSGPTFQGNPGDLTSGNLFFDGAATRALNDNNRTEVYAPNSFNGGSSISHLDGGAHPDSVMNAFVSAGAVKRVYTTEDIGVISDIGWTLNPVPEPGTLAIWGLFTAAGGVGVVRRRRRSVQRPENADERLAA